MLYGEEFLGVWKLYPRKVGKGAAWDAWRRKVRNGDAARIVQALSWQVESSRWREDDGRFVPHLATYLNQRRWEDEKPRDSFLDADDQAPSATEGSA